MQVVAVGDKLQRLHADANFETIARALKRDEGPIGFDGRTGRKILAVDDGGDTETESPGVGFDALLEIAQDHVGDFPNPIQHFAVDLVDFHHQHRGTHLAGQLFLTVESARSAPGSGKTDQGNDTVDRIGLIHGSVRLSVVLPGADLELKKVVDKTSAELGETVTPSPHHPVGVKGVGETGTIASTPTVYNAVLDALAPLGVEQMDMPLTSAKVWQAIQQANGGN